MRIMQNMKQTKKVFSMILVALGLAIFFYWFFVSPTGTSSHQALLKITGGQGLPEVADSLSKLDLIRSKTAFVLYGKLKGVDKKIHQGRYSMHGGMSIKEILNMITDPKRGEVSVTIPEGFSIYDIDEKLVNMGLISPGEFVNVTSTSEGYLFPDTYLVFNLNFDPKSLVSKMQDNFLKKISPEMLERIKKQKRTLPEVIKMASIIEKEVRTDKDYPIVSGILWKRLDSKWALQADATLLYGKSTTTISGKDLKEDTPYNTRINKGLPPTPICNPGMKSILAAISPEASEYWFYLTDSDGNVHYAKTNDEHNENKKKYLSGSTSSP